MKVATSHWVYSITTRIKTIKCSNIRIIEALIEYIPLQQGLRHKWLISANCYFPHWVYSITTRIKTSGISSFKDAIVTHWVYSITTRIKTPFFYVSHFIGNLIEYIPLQQGLRLWRKVCCVVRFSHWVYSITTRIKTFGAKPMRYATTSLSIFHYNKD